MDAITLKTLHTRYWYKHELAVWRRQHLLSATGSKQELVERIQTFLKTGSIPTTVPRTPQPKDGDILIPTSPVTAAYKSDARTRAFFKQHVGPHFHFTAHMNQWRRMQHTHGKAITYQDLINEWNAEYERRRNPAYQAPIPAACEYNQFIRSFFAQTHNATHADAVAAWYAYKAKRNLK